jgi:3-deoxy-D-manno-octulosonic-acid transferase
LRKLFGQQRPVFLLASSRDGEEALILNMLAAMEIPDLLTIIVPRHPQRFDEVEKLIQATGWPYQRRSEIHSALATTCKIVLGDSMGEMFSYYAACDIALIGGSLLPFGGQNLIEACAMGKPVLIGQHTFNFAEVSENAIATGAAIRLANPEALPATLTQLFASTKQRETMAQAARAFSLEHRGATDRLMQLIKPLC